MWLPEVFSVIYLAAVFATIDAQNAITPKPNLAQKPNFKEMYLGERITFTCTFNLSSEWNFLWYHNGTVMNGSNSTYTIAALEDSNSGEYRCRAQISKEAFNTELSDALTLQISQLPKPVLKLVSNWSDVFEEEIVEFLCETDSQISDLTFTWYKNNEQLEEDSVVTLEPLDPNMNITSIDRTYEGDYTCEIRREFRDVKSERSNTITVTVYEKVPQAMMKKEPDFNPMYVGETVNFTCDVAVATDWQYQWRRDSEDLDESGKTISIDLHPSAAGQYLCYAIRGRKITTDFSREIKQDVKKIPVPALTNLTSWSDVFPGERVEMICRVNDSSDWTYTWYREGQELQPGQRVSFSTNKDTLIISAASPEFRGEYKCKGHVVDRSVSTSFSPGFILTVYDEMPKVALKQDPEYKVMFPGESVLFSCHINVSSGWEYMWSKDTTSLSHTENKLTISPRDRSDQGSYECQAKRGTNQPLLTSKSQPVNILVEENKPSPLMTQQPHAEKVYVGEPLSLKCEIKDSAGWEYFWWKDGNQLSPMGNVFAISHPSLSDSGKYECMGIRNKTKFESKRSNKQEVIISGIPTLEVKKMPSWSDVFPTESVSLSCEMNDSSDWTYTWYREGQELQPGQRVSFSTNKDTLIISAASPEFRGEYKCKGHVVDRSVSTSFSPGFILTVYDEMPKVTLKQDPEYKVMFPGESVLFSCHINVSSGWEYMWSKDTTSLSHTENKLTISPRDRSDQGSYECQAKRGTNQPLLTSKSQPVNILVEENKPNPLMTQQPHAEKVYVGEPLSLKCEIKDSAGWEYFWWKDGNQLPPMGNVFAISHPSLSDSGKYECMGIRNKTKFESKRSNKREVIISEIPSPKVDKRTPWLHVFPTEGVSLSCDIDSSSDWTYTWYKDRQELHAGQGVSFDQDAAVLTIASASPSHRGQYSCSGKHKKRSVSSNITSGLQLDVYDAKPRVQLTQDPDHNLMHTEDSVSFVCHINVFNGWMFQWYKDDRPFPASGNNLTIKPLSVENAGSYKCQTSRGTHPIFKSDPSPTMNLSVEQRPKAEILLLTGWSRAFSTDSLVLSCSVLESQDIWNYTWYKEGQKIEQPPSVQTETYTVTPWDDPDQSLYTCQGFRSGRPSYSRTSDQFKTKNLLLKRRVLLSISGCIVFGICVICIGCVVLRVFRKSAEEEYKPEEADLFLRMGALKDSDDGLCPVVQYVTESALNASPKEEGENGTISSETPSPTTVQDEPAAMTTSDATEINNGGLISFK